MPPRAAVTCCKAGVVNFRAEEGGAVATDAELGVNENTRPEEAVRLAMERERRAREFYLRCAQIVADPGVKKMFEFLAKEESKHFEILEKEYNRFFLGDN